MSITVIISTWQVPFDQVVHGIYHFGDAEGARDFINAASKTWWVANGGGEGYEPIEELGYNHARYELWDGETGFHAMLDATSAQELHEAHYKREYDDKGKKRPGYLRAAYGEDVQAEIDEVFSYYGVRH